MTLIDTLKGYKRVIADLETMDGTELLIAQLRKRTAQIKTDFADELDFELAELNASMARHPSNIGRIHEPLTASDL